MKLIKRKFGFTLIELLIVVAIIAILAAIAIPNFLQAQVRAKIAHDLASEASVATALEAYRVDNANYPQDYPYYLPGSPNIYGGDITLYVLTTPVSYISSVPTVSFFYLIDPYSQYQTLKGKMLYYGERTIDYWEVHGATPDNELEGASWNSKWLLQSPGPMGDLGTFDEYNPTNGTVTEGAISRWGP